MTHPYPPVAVCLAALLVWCGASAVLWIHIKPFAPRSRSKR